MARKWSKPPWTERQEYQALKRGFAYVKNHKPQSPSFLKLTFRSFYKVEDEESKDLIFRLKDEESGKEYYLDAEEVRYWLRNV